jgi:hypothetical protein
MMIDSFCCKTQGDEFLVFESMTVFVLCLYSRLLLDYPLPGQLHLVLD